MKKIKALLVLAIMAVCAAVPATAYADIVDDICDEFGYIYRWTLEAELDETYDGCWLDEVSDDGRVRISYIIPEEEMTGTEEVEKGVIVIEGSRDMILGVASNTSTDTYRIRKEVAYEDGEWVEVEDSLYSEGDRLLRDWIYVSVYATGEEKTDNRFIMIHAGDRDSGGEARVTPIVLETEDVEIAEDTELSLKERNRWYHKNKNDRRAKKWSPNGKVILAEPVERADKKTPILSDDYYSEDEEPGQNEDENIAEETEKKVVYAPEKEVPEFDITLEEAEALKVPQVEFEGMDKNKGYSHNVLNGKRHEGTFVTQSVQDGKARFDIELPPEIVAEISSDGNVEINIQRYARYSTNTLDRDMVFIPHIDGVESEDEIILNMKGDLGEQLYFVETYGEKQTANGVYSVLYDLYPVFKMDEDVVIYESRIRIPVEEATTGGFIDTNDENYIYVKGDIAYLYCEFADAAYCGIEKIGVKFDNEIYAVDIDDTKMDFEVEADLSNWVIGKKAARKLLAEIRAERDMNNEVVNVLENGKLDFNINVGPQIVEKKEDDKEAEQKEELIVSNNEIRVNLKDNFLIFPDQKPVVDNERVLVPFRVIFEALGADVLWDNETHTVTAIKGDITISLTIGEKKIVKNGEVIEIDVPAQVQNERTLVPIRVVSESFGNVVSWDGENKIVEIK